VGVQLPGCQSFSHGIFIPNVFLSLYVSFFNLKKHLALTSVGITFDGGGGGGGGEEKL